MSDPKVIYLGPECEDEFCDGRTWADHVAWPDCDCNHKPVRYNIGSDYDAALAREAALREELAEFEEENSSLREVIRDIKNWREVSQSSAALSSLLNKADEVTHKPGSIQQRLTDAEKRVAELDSAAREMLRIAGIANQGSNAYNRAIINLNSVLKPVED